MPWQNFGIVKNQGVDASLNLNYKVGEVNLSARGNFTFARNEIREYDQVPQVYPWLEKKGTRLNSWKLYIVYGFGLNAEWRGFYAGIFFQGSGNTSTVLGASSNGAFFPFQWGVEESAVRSEVANRWTEQNPSQNVMFPRMHSNNFDNNTVASTWWLRDASFLRLKNVEIGYNFKEKTLKKIGIQALRVYLQGNNLCVWDDIKMWDPELGNTNGGFSYPLSRTFTFGLDFTF